ncbi:MBL fold metallo-hydrolase [candidate division KSB1 bacterium]
MEITVLGSGSRGNATIVGYRGRYLMIDAGFCYRDLTKRMTALNISAGDIGGIFITHEHADHVRSLEIFTKRHKVPVYLNKSTFDRLNRPLKDKIHREVRFFTTGSRIQLDNITLTSFPVSHDAADPVGYTLENASSKVGFVTDTGRVTRQVVENLSGSHCIVIEANHDIDMLWNGTYPELIKQRIAGPYGHLSNRASGELLRTVMSGKLKTVCLVHLSQENNRPDVALDTVSGILGEDYDTLPAILVTGQDSPSETVSV